MADLLTREELEAILDDPALTEPEFSEMLRAHINALEQKLALSQAREAALLARAERDGRALGIIQEMDTCRACFEERLCQEHEAVLDDFMTNLEEKG